MSNPKFGFPANCEFVVAVDVPRWVSELQYPPSMDDLSDSNSLLRSVAADMHLAELRRKVAASEIVLRDSVSHQPRSSLIGPNASDLMTSDDAIAFCEAAGISIDRSALGVAETREHPKPLGREVALQQAILRELVAKGFNPLAIQKAPPQGGAKKAVRESLLLQKAVCWSEAAFNKQWARLRKDGAIREDVSI